MTKYTVMLTKMMSQVIEVETDDGIKTAVAEALDRETISPGAGDGYEAAGETEVQCVDVDGVTVWEAETCDDRLLFEQ
jgi:hypothetical protein